MYNVYVRYAVQCTVSFVVTTKETEKKIIVVSKEKEIADVLKASI